MERKPYKGPDYIVLRFAEGIDHLGLDGVWFDRSKFPTTVIGKPIGSAVARPHGKFEVRDDGAVAEVWLVTRS